MRTFTRYLKIALSFIILPLLSSCATLLNEPYAIVTVNNQTSEPVSMVYDGDTIPMTRRANIRAERSKEPLKITILDGHRDTTITAEAQTSTIYYANILNLGLGFAVEHNNPKRYTYPRDVYYSHQHPDIHQKGKTPPPSDNNVYSKGNWDLLLTFPFINGFYLKPAGTFPAKPSPGFGFLGIGTGVDFYHKDKQFINFSGGFATDFTGPLPEPFNLKAEHTSMLTLYLTMSNNHYLFKYMSVGYGLSYAYNDYHHCYKKIFASSEEGGEYEHSWKFNENNHAFGFIVPVFFHYNWFMAGVQYRPTFYRPNSDKKFQYEHLITGTVGIKFHLRRIFR